MSELFRDNLIVGDSMAAKTRPTIGVLYQKLTDGYGHPILKKINSNTVVLGGAILALEKLTGVTAGFKPKTLNELLGIPCASVNPGSEKIALFGCGTGGAGLDWGQVNNPSIKQNNVLDLIPMRYGLSPLVGEDAAKYFMQKMNGDGTTFSWYLKEFDGPPTIKSCWKNAIDSSTDGTEIVDDIADSPKNEGIETFAQFELTLNTHDLHEYYASTGNLSGARYNTFGFYTGEKVEGANEYANVRLYAVVTFNNRDVSLESTSSFIYRVYSLV